MQDDDRKGDSSMTTKPLSSQADVMHRRAEELSGREVAPAEEQPSPEQIQYMLHELREQKIELEMQNDELRHAQQKLEESRACHFDLYDLAPVGYLTLDEQGLILEANLRAATLLGVERVTLLNQPLSRYISPEDQDSYALQRKQLAGTGTAQSRDMRMLYADGSTFWAHLQANPAQKGECWITLQDITELWQARQELLNTQKIESLGILAGGIAHDFNNILAAILGYISLARLQLHDPEKAKKRLEEAEKATGRAKDLAKQLLTFARGGEPVKKIIDMRALLKEAVGFALLGSNVNCVFSLADDLWPLEADEGQIAQVIHNLVLNAVQAMPEGGTVTVSAENVIARENGDRYVRFSVEDTGDGIPEENLLKIFDPYFTTKQHGSGLGLATCFSIIKKHGGKIRASSRIGKGSTFTASLRASVMARASESETQKTLSQGRGPVLVMDDEKMIREVTQALLEELGYTVECAENGSETVELYLKRREQGVPFAAVILDLTVPGEVGGRETIKNLLEIDPEVKAIACSGYTSGPALANYREYGFSGVLCKPFRLEELSAAMHELLILHGTVDSTVPESR
jgi:two-component system cell cycle sensor histidine kinase/response regulator CckA